MYSHWSEYMSTVSDDTLKSYLADWNQYIPEVVEAAVVETEKRGRPVAPGKIEEMRAHFEARRNRDIADHQNNIPSNYFSRGENEIAQAALENAPIYYSEVAILGFSAIMSPLFGSFLLASNLEKIEGKRGFWAVILFGLLWAAIVYYVNTDVLEKPIHVVSLGLNLAGGLILKDFFWKQFIGKNVIYRKRTLVYPIIAAVILITLVIMLAMLESTTR